MNSEDRIAKARRIGAKNAHEREKERQTDATERAERHAQLGEVAVRKRASAIAFDESVNAMGPNKTPDKWELARRAIRASVIEAARRQVTITYSQIQLVAYEETALKLAHRMIGRMCAEVNEPVTDRCLLSAIIVSAEMGRPGEGFEEFAAERGFTEALSRLQRSVFERWPVTR